MIYDFVSCSRRACELAYPDRLGNFADDARTWDFFSTEWALSASEFWDAVRTHEDSFNSQPLAEGWVQLFDWLHANGHSAHAVTARMMHWGNTLSWLGRSGLHFDSVHFTVDKSLVDVDVLIDDSPENLAALRDHPRRPTWLVVYDQPWNQDVVEADHRAFGTEHLGSVLKSIAGEHSGSPAHSSKGTVS